MQDIGSLSGTFLSLGNKVFEMKILDIYEMGYSEFMVENL